MQVACSARVGLPARHANARIAAPWVPATAATPRRCLARPHALQCDDTGLRCLSCTPGRVVGADGRCSVDCKKNWGIGCFQCTPLRCTQVDATFALGTSASSLQQGALPSSLQQGRRRRHVR